MCERRFIHVSKHLKTAHLVFNKEEKKILVNHAIGRVGYRTAKCPVSGCGYQQTRLDRHLKETHLELEPYQLHSKIEEVKMSQTIQLLRALRASNPTPMMVSSLDLIEEMQEHIVDVSPPQQSPEPTCGDPECVQRTHILKREIETLRFEKRQQMDDINDLRAKVQVLQRRVRRYKARFMSSGRPHLEPMCDEEEAGPSKRVPARQPVPLEVQQVPLEEQPVPLEEQPVPLEEQPVPLEEQPVPLEEQPVLLQEQPIPLEEQPSLQVEKVQPPQQQEAPVPRKKSRKEKHPGTTPIKGYAPWTEGSGRGNRMRFIPIPPAMEEYLDTYRDFHAGLNPTRKVLENAKSKVSRVKTFIFYMAHGHSRLCDWLFLDDMARIRGWVRSLVRGAKMKVTTAEFYLKNVANFVKFVSETPPRTSRLTKVQIFSLQREIRMCIKNLQRELVVHKMSVKRQKVGKLPLREDLKACLTRGRQRIPELLDDLEEEYSTRDRFLLYGFLTAYWSCLYGHRPGVYANLTDAEVVEAENTGGEDGYLLYVKEHKTARAFGEAQMFLTAEEFGWLQRWMAIKATTKEDKNSFLLYTKGRGPSKNLNVYLRMAWREMGLSGEINFTLIRTAIATYAKQSSNPADRKKVAEYMCHDVRTADKYYARNPDVAEAAAIRGIFASSLEEMPSTSGGALPLKKRKRQAEEKTGVHG
ncbi:uncharacterized protein LOC121639285 [Melanotaenia boesemani]|uniref:uncharacterized protein LOC121639285 n=1 Tax=Melanotaenia boesemani TaxID=1250792 RepID=UPI001C049918|nr:uncharacterized protein LOC121639285 [Melanotaenia boesemani]